MVSGHDRLGVAIIRPAEMSDGYRQVLSRAVHKLLPESPAAIVVDLSDVSSVSRLMQMTLLSLAIEASEEPATPLGFCITDAELARELAKNGPSMRVFASLDEARHALTTSGSGIPWIQRPLGSGSGAPGAAAGHVAEACLTWNLSEIKENARSAAFQLVWLARGPFELHLTLALRPQQQLLINVRNYSTAARSTPARNVRMRLNPADEARVLAKGAKACGRLVTGAGVAWWALLSAPASA